MLKKLFLFIITFLYIIGFVPNTSFGIFFDFMPLTCVFLILWGILFSKRKILKYAKPIALVIWIFTFYVFTVGLICFGKFYDNSSTQFMPYLKPIRMLLTFYGGAFLFDIYVRGYGNKYLMPLIRNMLICISINSLIIIFQGIIPGVNEALQSLIHVHISDIHFQTWSRPGGLLYSGGAMASVIAGLALPLLIFYYFLGGINLFVVVLVFILTNIAIVMTGRTGLLFTVIFFILALMMAKKKHVVVRWLLIGCFLFSAIVVTYGILKEFAFTNNNEMLRFNMERLARLVEPQTLNEGAGYQTLKVLTKQFYLPNGVTQLFFGDMSFSVYTRIIYITDMGYNRSIWLYGLLGMILYYALFIIIFKDSYRYIFIKKENVFYIIFFASYLAIEFKEAAIYSRCIFSILILIALCMYKEASGKRKVKIKPVLYKHSIIKQIRYAKKGFRG